MAAVTQNTTPARHVIGDMVVRFYNVSGPTGSTLATGMGGVFLVIVQQSTAAGTASLVTSFAVAQTGPAGATITFTSSAPMVTEIVAVFARVG